MQIVKKPLPETQCRDCKHYIINGWCTAKHQSAWYQGPKCNRYEQGTPQGEYTGESDYQRNKRYRQRRDRKALAEMQDPSDRRHGTRTGYVYGCRCDRCRQAVHDEWAAFQEWRKQA